MVNIISETPGKGTYISPAKTPPKSTTSAGPTITQPPPSYDALTFVGEENNSGTVTASGPPADTTTPDTSATATEDTYTPHTTAVTTPTTMTTEELARNNELAKVAANFAIARGIDPQADWLWKLSGEYTGKVKVDYLQNSTGYKLLPGKDDQFNTADDMYESPTGVQYTKDEMQQLIDQAKAEAAELKQYQNLPASTLIGIARDKFPDLHIVTSAKPQQSDDSGRMRTNTSNNFIYAEDLPRFLADNLETREKQIAALEQIVGHTFSAEQVDGVVHDILSDTAGFVDKLREQGRNTSTEGLLKTLNPDITDDEMRSIFGQAKILSLEDYLVAQGQSEADAQENADQINLYLSQDKDYLLKKNSTYTTADGHQIKLKNDSGHAWMYQDYQNYVALMHDNSFVATLGKSLSSGNGKLLASISGGLKWLGADGAGNALADEIAFYDACQPDALGAFSMASLWDWRFWTVTLGEAAPTLLPLAALTVATGGAGAAVWWWDCRQSGAGSIRNRRGYRLR